MRSDENKRSPSISIQMTDNKRKLLLTQNATTRKKETDTETENGI